MAFHSLSQRKIIHIDMDAFYASIEQRDHPSLQGKPVIVGGSPESRGVVASASYEARRFGVRSAMSCSQAKRLCPQAVFVTPHFSQYKEASHQLHEIFRQVTLVFEPLALDEAYLDVTQNLLHEPIAKNIALLLKHKIQETLRITASAGVGPNKFIAKLASEQNKPNGLLVIPPNKVASFVENLPIEKLWGVGPATSKKLHSLGIFSTADIRSLTPIEFEKLMGSYAHFLYELAHGRDERCVEAASEPKSRGTESTFEKDTTDTNLLLQILHSQCEELSETLQKHSYKGRTVTVKIKYSDFQQITRSQTLLEPSNHAHLLTEIACSLLFKETEVGQRPVRLLGVSIGNLLYPNDPLQLSFEFPRSSLNYQDHVSPQKS